MKLIVEGAIFIRRNLSDLDGIGNYFCEMCPRRRIIFP